MSDRGERTTMRPFGDLTPWPEACEIAARLALPPSRTERLPLLEAAGRVLAADAVSRIDVPQADRSAMDGYAVRAREVAGAGALRVADRISAGESGELAEIPAGCCVEIATGAPIPAGMDAVVPVEHTRREGDRLTVDGEVGAGDHVSVRGEDLHEGRPIGSAGQRLTPALLSACVAGGVTEVEVWSLPRVLVAPTGDEVVPLGGTLGPGQVYDSNAAGLQALVAEAGGRPEHAGIVIDRLDAMVSLFGQPEFDLVVTIGGTSVGRRDLVSEAMARVGETLVHGVAVKPGKPLLLGRVEGRTVVGLPGFPTSCLMQAYAIVAPMVRSMARLPARDRRRRARLAREISSPRGKVQLLPVALDGEEATPTFRMSSAISSIAHAHGWIEVPAEALSLPLGSEVDVRLF